MDLKQKKVTEAAALVLGAAEKSMAEVIDKPFSVTLAICVDDDSETNKVILVSNAAPDDLYNLGCGIVEQATNLGAENIKISKNIIDMLKEIYNE